MIQIGDLFGGLNGLNRINPPSPSSSLSLFCRKTAPTTLLKAHATVFRVAWGRGV